MAAGCSDTNSTPSTPQATTSVPATTTATQAPGFSLSPTPTDQMPSGFSVEAKAYKDPIDAMINVEFVGGEGLYMVDSVSTTVYLSDGRIVTESIEPKAMADVNIQGTKGEDRVTVTVDMNNGNSYKIFDQVIAYRK